LLERDTFDLFLPEFDKPWLIHLRETCCCSTNLCTWKPNTAYKNRCVPRYHGANPHPLPNLPFGGIWEDDDFHLNINQEFVAPWAAPTAPAQGDVAPAADDVPMIHTPP
jgi:hypothetical protein